MKVYTVWTINGDLIGIGSSWEKAVEIFNEKYKYREVEPDNFIYAMTMDKYIPK